MSVIFFFKMCLNWYLIKVFKMKLISCHEHKTLIHKSVVHKTNHPINSLVQSSLCQENVLLCTDVNKWKCIFLQNCFCLYTQILIIRSINA